MLVGHYPPPFGFFVVGMKFAAEIPEVLASVIEIYNLDGTRELLFADVPDPVGTIAHDHLDLRPTPAWLVVSGNQLRPSAGLLSSPISISLRAKYQHRSHHHQAERPWLWRSCSRRGAADRQDAGYPVELVLSCVPLQTSHNPTRPDHAPQANRHGARAAAEWSLT